VSSTHNDRAAWLNPSRVWLDRLLGSDPGFMRLRLATQTVVTIAIAMLAEALFVRLTHALQIDTHGATLPTANAAQVTAQHHGMLVIAIMLGAVVGMIGGFSGALFATPRALLTGFALMPVPMVAGLSLGLAVASHRVVALASLAVVLAAGAYLRRFGSLGFVGGMLLFVGDFFGFFLYGSVVVSDIGWLALEIVIGAIVAVVAQFTIFYPSRRSALRRMQASFAARARRVAATALALTDSPKDQAPLSGRLHRQLIRLNETALMIDVQLGELAAVPAGWTAVQVHQQVFDTELALTNMARFAERISELSLPTEVTEHVRVALRSVVNHDAGNAANAGAQLLAMMRSGAVGDECLARSVVVRFAISAQGYAAATLDTPQPDDTGGSFESPATLFGGWLPGSAMVSAVASSEAGHRWLDRIRLASHSRVAIQMAVAVTGAIVLGDLLSGRRFYWAVIAAFVTFMGANNAGEQLRKGFYRVTGTVIGVLIGALLAHVVGQRTDLAIAVILGSLFIGLYLMRISYGFMVIGITVMVSQLYVQLDEFSDSLLVLRLEETALGAGVAALTVLCVVPLRTQRVARVAFRQYLHALIGAVELAIENLGAPGHGRSLRNSARTVDATYQALLSTVVPRRVPFIATVDSQRLQFLHSVSASRHYVRNLISDAADGHSADWPAVHVQGDLAAATDVLLESLQELVAALQVMMSGLTGTPAAQRCSPKLRSMTSPTRTRPRDGDSRCGICNCLTVRLQC
jgi:uncharacterized membrane protein YgaE (UPF0421/DUF939 family)